jgi:hypothetical protein
VLLQQQQQQQQGQVPPCHYPEGLAEACPVPLSTAWGCCCRSPTACDLQQQHGRALPLLLLLLLVVLTAQASACVRQTWACTVAPHAVSNHSSGSRGAVHTAFHFPGTFHHPLVLLLTQQLQQQQQQRAMIAKGSMMIMC